MGFGTRIQTGFKGILKSVKKQKVKKSKVKFWVHILDIYWNYILSKSRFFKWSFDALWPSCEINIFGNVLRFLALIIKLYNISKKYKNYTTYQILYSVLLISTAVIVTWCCPDLDIPNSDVIWLILCCFALLGWYQCSCCHPFLEDTSINHTTLTVFFLLRLHCLSCSLCIAANFC